MQHSVNRVLPFGQTEGPHLDVTLQKDRVGVSFETSGPSRVVGGRKNSGGGF